MKHRTWIVYGFCWVCIVVGMIFIGVELSHHHMAQAMGAVDVVGFIGMALHAIYQGAR